MFFKTLEETKKASSFRERPSTTTQKLNNRVFLSRNYLNNRVFLSRNYLNNRVFLSRNYLNNRVFLSRNYLNNRVFLSRNYLNNRVFLSRNYLNNRVFLSRNYLNNRVFLSRNYRLIVAPRKFDALKTNICPRSFASRANMLVLRTSNFQGATIRPIVPRQKHSIV